MALTQLWITQMARSSTQNTGGVFKTALFFLYIFSFIGYFYLLYLGSHFYQASAQEQFLMHDFRSWRPAGSIGHGLGFLGSLMMILMLLYSIRKRTRLFGELGHISYWLQIHIFFGIMGPLLIVLHTSFRIHGLVAVSFWSMIAVAVSGILGRYLYLQLPRNIFGDELDLDQAKDLGKSFQAQLVQSGLEPKQIVALQSILSPAIPHQWGTMRKLGALFIQNFSKTLRLNKAIDVLSGYKQVDISRYREIISISKQQALLQRRIHLWNSFHSLFHYWHVIHRPFAYIMYLIMLVHIGVAFWLGYTWVF